MYCTCTVEQFTSDPLCTVHVQLSNMKSDHSQEAEAMQRTVRGLRQEVGLHQMVIETFIPDQYQQLIQSHATWNEDTGEWHLVSVCMIMTCYC